MNREKRDRRTIRAECFHGRHDWCEGCACGCHESDSPALGGFDPGTDIRTLERAGESLSRLGDMENAIRLFALALRIRAAAGVWEESDE